MTASPFLEVGRNRDLSGLRFGKLVVLGLVARLEHARGLPVWRCVCDCGAVVDKRGINLTTGHTKSCGCNSGSPLPEGESSFNKLLGRYRRCARYRGLAFDLSADEFRALTQGACSYCGAGPSNVFAPPTHNGAYVWNGVDRIDRSQGYTVSNSVSCCSPCNDMKGVLNGDEFIRRVKAIAAHQERK